MRLNMKYVVLIVIAICLIGSVFSYFPIVNGVEDPFTINYSLWYLDYPRGGSQSITLIITNVSGVTEDIVVSSWWNFYEYTDPSYSWIDPSWCTRINPSTQTLLPGESMISNVEYTVPDNVPDAKWITWIKVSEGTLDKPVTVALRKGTAIPKYDYSIEPGDYRLGVTGYDASVIVNDPTDNTAPPIRIKNKTNTTGLFLAEVVDCPQQEGSPDGITKISSDTGLQHTEDEVGLELTNLTAEEVRDWISFSATEDKPLEVAGRQTSLINWELHIPDSLRDGDYLMLVRVRPATDLGPGEGQTGININLGTWLRLKVDRQVKSKGFDLGYWPIVGMGGLLVIVSLVYIVGSRNGKTSKLPEYRTLGRS